VAARHVAASAPGDSRQVPAPSEPRDLLVGGENRIRSEPAEPMCRGSNLSPRSRKAPLGGSVAPSATFPTPKAGPWRMCASRAATPDSACG